MTIYDMDKFEQNETETIRLIKNTLCGVLQVVLKRKL